MPANESGLKTYTIISGIINTIQWINSNLEMLIVVNLPRKETRKNTMEESCFKLLTYTGKSKAKSTDIAFQLDYPENKQNS